MGALEQSVELIRQSDELRARSERIRVAADEKMEKSRRLIAACLAREAKEHRHGWEPAERTRAFSHAMAGW